MDTVSGYNPSNNDTPTESTFQNDNGHPAGSSSDVITYSRTHASSSYTPAVILQVPVMCQAMLPIQLKVILTSSIIAASLHLVVQIQVLVMLKTMLLIHLKTMDIQQSSRFDMIGHDSIHASSSYHIHMY